MDTPSFNRQMQSVVGQLNLMTGYPAWDFHPQDPSVAMRIPGFVTDGNVWNPQFDFEQEQDVLQQTCGPDRVQFWTSSDRDTNYAGLVLKSDSVAALAEMADDLERSGLLRDVVRSLVMKADPYFVINRMMGGVVLDEEEQILRQLMFENKHENMESLIHDRTLTNNQRFVLDKHIPLVRFEPFAPADVISRFEIPGP